MIQPSDHNTQHLMLAIGKFPTKIQVKYFSAKNKKYKKIHLFII